jgi:hypothetical protein
MKRLTYLTELHRIEREQAKKAAAKRKLQRQVNNERSTSVRTVSGGGFETNRRKH